MSLTSPDDAETCSRAEALLEQAGLTEDDSARDGLYQQAYLLLAPLVAASFPEAMYLHACCTLFLEGLDDQAHEKRWVELVKQAAQAGHARAQFNLGQMYEPDAQLPGDAEMSAYWFEQSALQGYPYAQWVHGLNLLDGHSRPRDEALDLDFIRRAAEGRFEGAIQFVADAYAAGTHGYPKDEAKAETWRRRLDEPGVMSY